MATATFEATFHSELDNTFSQLAQTTSQILGCTDEDLNTIALKPHTTGVISSVKTTQEAFHSLRLTAEQGIAGISSYSQEVFAKEHGFDKLNGEIATLKKSLGTELVQVSNTRETYRKDFEDAQREVEDLERILREYDEKVKCESLCATTFGGRLSIRLADRSKDFFSKFFCANAWDQYGGRKRDQESLRNRLGWRHTHMRQLQALIETALGQLDVEAKRVDLSFAGCLESEEKIIDSKKVADHVYDKIYDMEVCLTSRDIEISVEDAIRHILKLLYLSLAIVDEDTHIQDFKRKILEAISEKYGVEKTEELKQEKKLLEFDI